MEQRSPEWHTKRKGRVTGSVAGAVLGLAPYMTRGQVLRSMVRVYHGAPSEFTGNIATEWETNNEKTAIECYEFKTGNKVTPAPFVPFEDWSVASPDGYIGEDGLIEVKCPFGKRNASDGFKPIKEQPHYYAQMQIEMLAAGRKWCHFYQWSPHGDDLDRVEYSQDWHDKNLPVLRQFYAEYLSDLDNPIHLEPLRRELNTQKVKLLIDEMDQLKEAIDNATARRKEVLEDLVLHAGSQNALMWGRKLTLVEKDGSISYAKAIKDLVPDADLTKYKGKPSEYWTLS